MVIPLKNNKNHFDRGPFYILKPAELLPGRYSSANYCWSGEYFFDGFMGPLDSWWLKYVGCWWLRSNFAYSRFNRRSSWKPRPMSSPSETHTYHKSPFLASPSAATPSLSPSLASPAPASSRAASPVTATPSFYSLSPSPASPTPAFPASPQCVLHRLRNPSPPRLPTSSPLPLLENQLNLSPSSVKHFSYILTSSSKSSKSTISTSSPQSSDDQCHEKNVKCYIISPKRNRFIITSQTKWEFIVWLRKKIQIFICCEIFNKTWHIHLNTALTNVVWFFFSMGQLPVIISHILGWN